MVDLISIILPQQRRGQWQKSQWLGNFPQTRPSTLPNSPANKEHRSWNELRAAVKCNNKAAAVISKTRDPEFHSLSKKTCLNPSCAQGLHCAYLGSVRGPRGLTFVGAARFRYFVSPVCHIIDSTAIKLKEIIQRTDWDPLVHRDFQHIIHIHGHWCDYTMFLLWLAYLSLNQIPLTHHIGWIHRLCFRLFQALSKIICHQFSNLNSNSDEWWNLHIIHTVYVSFIGTTHVWEEKAATLPPPHTQAAGMLQSAPPASERTAAGRTVSRVHFTSLCFTLKCSHVHHSTT